MAQAPVYSNVPDVKLWNTKALSNAFDLEAFNTSDPATTWSIITNENSVVSISGSTPSYFGLTLASDPPSAVAIEGTNEGGSAVANQKVKHSAYLFAKLSPQAILPGKSVTVPLANVVFDDTGAPVTPLSFATADAVRIVGGAGFTASISGTDLTIDGTGAVTAGDVVVSASPLSASPFAANYDNGIVAVAPVLNAFSEFSAASDTTQWFFGLPLLGATSVPPLTWNANFGGKDGVLQFTCGATADGVKISTGTGIAGTNGDWYTIRGWVLSSVTPATTSKNVANINIFATDVGGAARQGRSIFNAKAFGGNAWQQMEAYAQAFTANCTIAPQLVVKNVSHAANLYVDAIEIFQGKPAMGDAFLVNSIPVPNGSFDSGTAGWFFGLPLNGATAMSAVAVVASAPGGATNALQLTFSATQQGLKLSYGGAPITAAAGAAIKQSVKVYSAVSNGSRAMNNVLFITDSVTGAVLGPQTGINNGAGFNTGSWQTVEAISPAIDNPNATSIGPQIVVKNGNGASAASDVVYIDDIALTQDGDGLHFFRFDPALMP